MTEFDQERDRLRKKPTVNYERKDAPANPGRRKFLGTVVFRVAYNLLICLTK